MVDADLGMQSAIMYGLDQPIENVVQQGTFKCPSGNCTWPSFHSLAVCNRCTNLTDGLERLVSNGNQSSYLRKDSDYIGSFGSVNDGTAFRLSNGLYLDNENGWTFTVNATHVANYRPGVMLATLGTANASDTASVQDLDTLIWSMSMIRADPYVSAWPDMPVSAVECALFYCVNNFEITVSNGALQQSGEQATDFTRASDSWDAPKEYASQMTESQLNSIAFDKMFSAIPRSDLALESATNGSRFSIAPVAVNSISHYYQSTFASQLYDLNITETPSKKGRLNGYYMRSSQIEYEPSVMQTLFSTKDLNSTFTALAASMSNAMRTGPDGSLDGVPISVTGMKGEVTTFYRIVWPWIFLHCFIVLLGAVFLGITIRENRRYGRMVPLWKSSSLAIACHGKLVTGVLSGMQTVEDIRSKARVSRVTFSDSDDMASPSRERLHSDCLEDITWPHVTVDVS